VIDQPWHGKLGRGGDQRSCEGHFVRADVRADVIDRARAPDRPRDRIRIVHRTNDDLGHAECGQGGFVRGTAD
jgi:hypothetical protein